MLQIQRSLDYGNCFAVGISSTNIVSRDGNYTIEITIINSKCNSKIFVKQTITSFA